eukprot:SM003899S14267  [mRNA]  locus=s3899:20:1296:+ [translate_table: standard]
MPTRLDAVRQGLLLFVHAKLRADPRHRFAVATLGDGPAWRLRHFTGDVDAVSSALRSLSSGGMFLTCDLAALFRMVGKEARRTTASGRVLRLVIIYCRSNVVPSFSSTPPPASPHGGKGVLAAPPPRAFTVDAVYLHNRPVAGTNCPQAVYDAIISTLEAVSEHESYIFESASNLARSLFQAACLLLMHPMQRCKQDELDIPWDLAAPLPSQQPPLPAPLASRQRRSPSPRAAEADGEACPQPLSASALHARRLLGVTTRMDAQGAGGHT